MSGLAGYALFGIGEMQLLLAVLILTLVSTVVLARDRRRLQIDLDRSRRENQDVAASLEDAEQERISAHDKLAEAVAKNDRLARIDSLTQLANRGEFDEELDRQLASLATGQSRYLSLAYVDLDNFKYVNDTHGHDAGDQLLVAVARRLRGIARHGETIARIGGDELVLITRAYDPREIGDRLKAAFVEPFSIAGRPFELTASIGVATARETITRDELMQRADKAQYAAKHNGGNAYQIFSSNLPSGPPGWLP